jgi:oligosaccharide repeat unit polymerase
MDAATSIFLGLILLLVSSTLAFKLQRVDGPSVIMCAAWGSILISYGLANSIFYSIQIETLATIFAAALAFGLGGIVRHLLPYENKRINIVVHPFLFQSTIIWIILLTLALPIYYKTIVGDYQLNEDVNIFAAIRIISLQEENNVRGFSLVRNLLPISFILPIATYFSLGEKITFSHKFALGLAIFIALLYGLLTGSKGVVPGLAIAMCLARIIKSNGVFRGSGVGHILFFGLLGVFAMMRIFNFAFDNGKSEIEVWGASVRTALAYSTAPINSFDLYLRNPEYLDVSGQHLSRPFIYMANSVLQLFGYKQYQSLVPLHLPFTDPGPDFETAAINTYTYLISYVSTFGRPLAFVALFLLGIAVSLVHKLAISGDLIWMIFYCYISRAFTLCFGGDYLILDFPNQIRALIATSIVIYLTPAMVYSISQFYTFALGKKPAEI